MRMKKRILALLCIGTLVCSSMTALADYNFTKQLPAYKGDVEASKVEKSSSTAYFKIKITSISNDFNCVYAWTEKPAGGNLSSPYYGVNAGETRNVSYTTLPSVGTNVVLNLDNPEYSAVTPTVKGSWNPY